MGSPAHAGMAPEIAGDVQVGIRFPRPRGDGPPRHHRRVEGVEVPPPTRGWPLRAQYYWPHSDGSPAHAGMAPYPAITIWQPWGFPRPRGDGPVGEAFGASSPSVPPPTRGWPRHRHWWQHASDGSPAHAGMALAGRKCPGAVKGFPRPRGDGPLDTDVAAVWTQVPPPTRGWPLVPDPLAIAGLGSPAHAGMAPRIPCSCRRTSWFPRPRGDGPRDAQEPAWHPGVPPPTRGWPAALTFLLCRYVGSPAHAGMAPCKSHPAPRRPGFPRPRGDGPCTRTLPATVATVPPPTRGWPLANDHLALHGWGSPAHAGMAP